MKLALRKLRRFAREGYERVTMRGIADAIEYSPTAIYQHFKDKDALVDAIKAVLAEAVEAGGSSISDYAGADGALGYFQHSFRVYGREGEPCPDSCDGMVERVVQGGRSTFYCPRCQT